MQTSQKSHLLDWTWQRRREDVGPSGLQAFLSVHRDTRLIGGQSRPLFRQAGGLAGARGGEAAGTQTCMTFPGGCPRPSVQTSPATSWTCSGGAGCGHGACESPALGEPGTPGWGGKHLNLRIPPLQASSGTRTGPSSGRQGLASSLEPLGRLPAGTDGCDGWRAKIIGMMSPGQTGE